jgi:hypothetical protein
MVNNYSKKHANMFNDLLYGSNFEETNPEQTQFDIDLIETMIYTQCSLRESLEMQFAAAHLDITSVFALTDYLEKQTGSLNKTSYFMKVYNGEVPDEHLVRKKDGE